MMRWLITMALSLMAFCWALSAHAGEPDPDEMIARGHYARGESFFVTARYTEALREFRAARAAKAAPALDYNVGRALEALGRADEALIEYRRYLRSPKLPAAEVAEVQARIRALEAAGLPAPEPPPAPPPTPPPPAAKPLPALALVVPSRPRLTDRHYLAPWLVGGGALALAVAGAGALGGAMADFDKAKSTCAPRCPDSALSPIADKEKAGAALLAVAGVVVVLDVALWVVQARKGRK